MAEETTIKINKNGPYIVTGCKQLTNSKGEPVETKDVMALCRCGGSKSKPFCDGSHKSAGFVDDKN